MIILTVYELELRLRWEKFQKWVQWEHKVKLGMISGGPPKSDKLGIIVRKETYMNKTY